METIASKAGVRKVVMGAKHGLVHKNGVIVARVRPGAIVFAHESATLVVGTEAELAAEAKKLSLKTPEESRAAATPVVK